MAGEPKFELYGESDPNLQQNIQPEIGLRDWGALTNAEKQIIAQQLQNLTIISKHPAKTCSTIAYLNFQYLRTCPGKRLHKIPYRYDQTYRIGNEREREKAATQDFLELLLTHENDALVLLMLSKLASEYIDEQLLSAAEKYEEKERERCINMAFKDFDVLSSWLNHIFEQFGVNQRVTRSGFIPRQDGLITEKIYVPTLYALSNRKWKAVNDDLRKAFDDYRNKDYGESITKAHSVVHRFLQIACGEEGKSGKGEVAKLFAKAKAVGAIPASRFAEQLLNALQSYFSSERATNSTAKPSTKEASASDALLMLNLVMVFLQHALQTSA